MIPVSASLTPLVPKVKVANVSMAVDVSNLPNFVPRTIEVPEAPQVNAPEANIFISLALDSKSKGSWGYATAMNNNNKGQGVPGSIPGQYNGVFEAVTVLDGKIDATRTNSTDRDGYSNWNYTACI
jgi:hypothetical protein